MNPEFEKYSINHIPYQTNDHKNELFGLLKKRLTPVLQTKFYPTFEHDRVLETTLRRIRNMKGSVASLFPDTAVVRIFDASSQNQYITMIKDVGHMNMTSMFGEDNRIEPERTKMTVLKGVVGSYSKLMLRVQRANIKRFVDDALSIQSEADYERLLDNYGVRRTDPTFWKENDLLHLATKHQSELNYGIIDLSRYENR